VDQQMIKRAVVEFIGPFALCFMGIGSILLTGNIVAIALAHGLAIGLCVMAAGHVSGGHFNPAITTAMIATKRITPYEGGVYIVAQLLGAVSATIMIILAIPSSMREGQHLGIPAIGSGFSSGNALVAEIIATFFLVFVVFGVAVDQRSAKAVSGLAIGLTITMDILGIGPISGAAMNPARWFGPALIDTNLSDFWVWIVGPLVGALLAAFLWSNVLFVGEPEAQAPAPADNLR
jgi:MIP family channel proteins